MIKPINPPPPAPPDPPLRETASYRTPARATPQIDLEQLNPGIRRTVAWLREQGFETCDSGDGKTREHECDRDHAYVVISVRPIEIVNAAQRLQFVLAKRDIYIDAIGEGAPCIQASYDPANGLAFIDLMHVDDVVLEAERCFGCGRELEDGHCDDCADLEGPDCG